MNTVASTIETWQAGSPPGKIRDELACEEPLEIRVDSHSVCVTMRTPGQDRELAAGFLVSEGVVRRGSDIARIRPYPRNAQGNVIGVFLKDTVKVDLGQLTRHVFASSSCGLCGKATIDSVQQRFPRVRSRTRFAAKQLLQLPPIMQARQKQFARTGGLHAAAVFDRKGELVVLREDVGRHNAVDKVLGHAVLNDQMPLSRHLLLVSGRASFEIMQKALAARIPLVAAVSAPSSLAVDFARESGQTLVGFLREDRMNVYSGMERIKG